MPATTLEGLLGQLGKDYFYMMHLSYGQVDRTDRQPLWDFARTHNLIGLDYHNMNRPWQEISEHARNQLTWKWQYQFRTFSGMQLDDLVVVVDGITHLLGIARVNGPYEFQPKLDDDFFRHVRRVEWYLAYEYARRKPEKFGGFLSTLIRVDEESSFWEKTKIKFDLESLIPGRVSRRVVRERVELEKKYGPGGERDDHKRLKKWVYDHPETIGLAGVIDGEMEHRFATGDRADVVFNLPGGRFAVVEVETTDTFTGARQALKYKALKCMEAGLNLWSNKVEPVLVAWQTPVSDGFCGRYGVSFIKKSV